MHKQGKGGKCQGATDTSTPSAKWPLHTYMVDPGQCPAGSRTMETDSVESEMDRVTGSSIGKDF